MEDEDDIDVLLHEGFSPDIAWLNALSLCTYHLRLKIRSVDNRSEFFADFLQDLKGYVEDLTAELDAREEPAFVDLEL